MGEERNSIMHDFEYVSKEEYMPEKTKIIQLLQDVQRDLKLKMNIHFKFVGSASRNMITRDRKSNIGYDFDVNISVDDIDDYKPKFLRTEIKKSIDKYADKYGYSPCENSTSVLTIKVKDTKKSKILHSCDFAIVDEYEDENEELQQDYIRFNKKDNSYGWYSRSMSLDEIRFKIDWLKDNGYWQDVRNQYIENKNKNDNPDVKSRSVFSYTVSEVFNWYYEEQ